MSLLQCMHFTIVLRSGALGHKPLSGAKKIILLSVLSTFDLISGFKGIDGSDSHGKGGELVVCQPFVLICQCRNQQKWVRQPALFTIIGTVASLVWIEIGILRQRCMCVSVPVTPVFPIRSKHMGERLVNSVARSHLAALKPTAMRWTSSSSPMSQGSAVAGRFTTPRRVRYFLRRGYYSPSTPFINTNSLCPIPFSERNAVPAACPTRSVYHHQRPATCVSISGLFHCQLQDWV